VVLTARTGFAAGIGSVVVAATSGLLHVPGLVCVGAFEAVLGAGIALDLAQSGRPQDLEFVRQGDTTARLGTEAHVSMLIRNNGRRPVHGVLRDAWPPSAGNTAPTKGSNAAAKNTFPANGSIATPQNAAPTNSSEAAAENALATNESAATPNHGAPGNGSDAAAINDFAANGSAAAPNHTAPGNGSAAAATNAFAANGSAAAPNHTAPGNGSAAAATNAFAANGSAAAPNHGAPGNGSAAAATNAFAADGSVATPNHAVHGNGSAAAATNAFAADGSVAAPNHAVHGNGSAAAASTSRPDQLPTEPRHEIDLAPGAAMRIDTVLTPTRRGDRRPDLVTVRSIGPFGLAGRQVSREVGWRLRVLPPFNSRKHLPSRLAQLRETDGRSPVLVRGQGSEFDSLREYVIGDDVRSIDWRATARRNDVVVRTWRPERDRHVVIVLDTSRTSAGRVGDEPKLDSAMDAALLLTAVATRAGDRVDLLAYDDDLRTAVTGALPGRTLAVFSDAMAVLEPALVELDGTGLTRHLLGRVRRRSLIVLLTSLDTASINEGLLPELRQLTRKHTVILASVADPRIADLAVGRGSANAVFAAASAELSLSVRRRTADELSRVGVEVVDAVPRDFAPALADRYLALKAQGRL
jgi:uncharacterized protein (DUF58 family)